MVAHWVWPGLRRAVWWGVPAALAAALIWTLIPHPRPEMRPEISSPPSAGAQAPGAAVRPPASAQAGGGPYATIQKGDLTGTDETGRQRWRIVADSVLLMQNGERFVLQRVRATFYLRNGGTIQVDGRQGWYDAKTHEVQLDGNVHATSSSGRELFADRLHWVAASGRLTGTGHVRFVQEHVVMYADEMQSDTLLGQTRFRGHVHAALP
jgi:LPS export ABC transporter protein LptC